MTDKPQGFIIFQYLEGLQTPRVVAAKSIYDVYRSLLMSDWSRFAKDTMLLKIIIILAKKGPYYEPNQIENGTIERSHDYSNRDIIVALSDESIKIVFEAVFDKASSSYELSISVTPLNPMIPSIYETFKPGKVDERLSEIFANAGL